MFSKNPKEIKNQYSIFEYFTLGISFFLTKIFFPGAKLVTYPVYIRGKKNLQYGNNLNIGYGCRFDLLSTQGKSLKIGENCEIGDYCHIVATEYVTIGDNFLCASKVFISDTSHGNYKGYECSHPTEPPKERELYSDPVIIGDNVWVGDNVVILPGTRIGSGCVIGANAVVSGQYEDNCIIAGVPAQVIKKYDAKSRKWERTNLIEY